MYKTNTVDLPLFQWDFDAYAKGCQEDRHVTPLKYWVETQYGGRNIQAHSNIIFR